MNKSGSLLLPSMPAGNSLLLDTKERKKHVLEENCVSQKWYYIIHQNLTICQRVPANLDNCTITPFLDWDGCSENQFQVVKCLLLMGWQSELWVKPVTSKSFRQGFDPIPLKCRLLLKVGEFWVFWCSVWRKSLIPMVLFLRKWGYKFTS